MPVSSHLSYHLAERPSGASPQAPRADVALGLVALGLAAGLLGFGMRASEAADSGALMHASPVAAVSGLDADRYAGMWYELARTPGRSLRQCVADVTATYVPAGDGSLQVENRCRRADGRMTQVSGIARAQSTPVHASATGGDARYEVSYGPEWLQWVGSSWSDHWVVALDPDYRVTVVSDRSGQRLRLLSREPRVTPELYTGLINHLRQRGFAVDRLVPTTQEAVSGIPKVVRPALMA